MKGVNLWEDREKEIKEQQENWSPYPKPTRGSERFGCLFLVFFLSFVILFIAQLFFPGCISRLWDSLFSFWDSFSLYQTNGLNFKAIWHCHIAFFLVQKTCYQYLSSHQLLFSRIWLTNESRCSSERGKFFHDII
jgi:hypothetical protein